MSAEKPIVHCFICERPMRLEPPYVDLGGKDGYDRPAIAHFVCWTNAQSPLMRVDGVVSK